MTHNWMRYRQQKRYRTISNCFPSGDGHSRSLSVLYTNARSLIPKRDELSADASLEEPDVITITDKGHSHLLAQSRISCCEIFHQVCDRRKGKHLLGLQCIF